MMKGASSDSIDSIVRSPRPGQAKIFSVMIEKIFAWPGLGLLTIESIESLDAPVIMAVVLMFGVAVQVGNLLADIAVAALDPRIRLG